MARLMAGFDSTAPGPVSRALGRGKFRRVAQSTVVPAGDRHAVRDGETESLCGKSIAIIHGEWSEKRGLGFRDCPACAAELAESG
jgi:hypothetical protein